MGQEYKIGDHAGMVDLVALRQAAIKPAAQLWYVLEVRPGKDATVMRSFRRRNVEAYSPTIRRSEVVRGRKRDVVVPLFPGLILMPDFETNIDLKAFDGVIGFARFGEFFIRLRADDMEQIRRIEAIGNLPLSKRKRMFETGQLVRVVDGPFASFSGRIERLDSRGRLSVLVDIFSRMTPIELEEGQIEPVNVSTDTGNGSAGARRRHRRIPH